MTEEWKDIFGYEGYYQVSNFGCVKSIDRIIYRDGLPARMKGVMLESKVNEGARYLRITLSSHNKQHLESVHRLVAMAFIPNPENKPCVNHIDGNKINNNVSNLEWCTQLENNRHAIENGLNPRLKSHPENPQNKRICQFDLSGNKINEFSSIRVATKETGINNISRCALGKYSQAGGYSWRYI